MEPTYTEERHVLRINLMINSSTILGMFVFLSDFSLFFINFTNGSYQVGLKWTGAKHCPQPSRPLLIRLPKVLLSGDGLVNLGPKKGLFFNWCNFYNCA